MIVREGVYNTAILLLILSLKMDINDGRLCEQCGKRDKVMSSAVGVVIDGVEFVFEHAQNSGRGMLENKGEVARGSDGRLLMRL